MKPIAKNMYQIAEINRPETGVSCSYKKEEQSAFVTLKCKIVGNDFRLRLWGEAGTLLGSYCNNMLAKLCSYYILMKQNSLFLLD